MKKTSSLKIAGAVLASTLAALTVRADLAINENTSLLGYAAGSIQYRKASNQGAETPMDIDAAKIGMALDFEPLAASVSIYAGEGAEGLHLLDAEISYDLGKNFTLTGGRFLTWIGYEAFDIPETTFITWGVANDSSEIFAGLIPDYHEGVKIEYAHGRHEFGLAILDSIYWGRNDYSGDGGIRDGLGIEAHYGHAAGKWSLGATLGYQYEQAKNSSLYEENASRLIADVWSEINLDDVTLAAEFFYRHDESDSISSQSTCYALLLARRDLSDRISIAGRLSHGKIQDYGSFWKLSLMPFGYEVSNNLSFRTEITGTRYSKSLRDSGEPKYEFLIGVQAVFKF